MLQVNNSRNVAFGAQLPQKFIKARASELSDESVKVFNKLLAGNDTIKFTEITDGNCVAFRVQDSRYPKSSFIIDEESRLFNYGFRYENPVKYFSSLDDAFKKIKNLDLTRVVENIIKPEHKKLRQIEFRKNLELNLNDSITDLVGN